jgi:hypothetical protein
MNDEPSDLDQPCPLWDAWQAASALERRGFLLRLAEQFLRSAMHDPKVTHFVCGVRTAVEDDEDVDDDR